MWRDSRPEPFEHGNYDEGERLRIGAPGVTIEPGEHVWQIRYRLTQVLRADGARDALHWDVTGNEWAFPIDHATLRLRLPARVAESDLTVEAWTGAGGDTGTDFKATKHGDAVEVVSTRPFETGEGLTVRIGWPAGLVTRPPPEALSRKLIAENVGLGYLGLALLAGLLAHLVTWWFVGRDPSARALSERYEPPDGLSPGAARYLAKMRFDKTCFTSTLLSLAGKGRLRIEERGGLFVLHREGDEGPALTPDERGVLSKVFSRGGSVEVDDSNRKVLRDALDALKRDLETAHLGRHFRMNARYLVPGGLASAIGFLVVTAMGWGERAFIAGFVLLWLSLWSVAVAMLLRTAFRSWRSC